MSKVLEFKRKEVDLNHVSATVTPAPKKILTKEELAEERRTNNRKVLRTLGRKG